MSILADGQLRVDLSSGAEVAYGEAVELSEKAMALRALLDYAVEKGASVISADVRVPSAPTAVLSGRGGGGSVMRCVRCHPETQSPPRDA